MNCPKCGGKTAVTDGAKATDEIYRRRKCLVCDHRFFTIEYEVENDAEFYKTWTTHHRDYIRRRAKNKEENV